MSRLSLLSFLLLAGIALPAPAADADKREAAATLKSPSGTFLAREPGSQDWNAILHAKDVFSEDTLLGLHDGTLLSKNKGVEVRTVADLSNRSPYPIIETVIRLNAAKDADIDLTLERGRLDITNVKEKGPARVTVRFLREVWTLVLDKPGTRIALEIYSRWPNGTRFNVIPNPGDAPMAHVLLVVLKGEVQRSCPLCSVAMTAPPGPSQFGWDSVHGNDRGPKRLDVLPDWVKDLEPNSPESKRRLMRRQTICAVLLKEGFGEALLGLIESKDAETRRVGVYGLGAFDQLRTLGDLLAKSEDMETWNNAVIALRHWLGRGPQHPQMLYERMVKRGLTPNHAKIVLQMLMGFTEEEVARPELYRILAEHLRHEKLAIRGLAYWYLQRLAPQLKIAYNPLGKEAEWNKAHDEYKKAIDEGKMPPKD